MSDPILEAVRSTCILASVRFTTFGATRTDKSTSREVSQAKDAVDGAARVIVKLLAGADEHHRAIQAHQRGARDALFRNSMPFGSEDGWRLLPNANFERFLRDFAASKRAFDAAVAQLRADAADVIAKAKANIGHLNADLPSPDELVAAYTMDYDFRPVPDGSGFGLPPQAAQKLTRRLDARVAAAVTGAMNDTLSRFVQPLTAFVERMHAYDERVKAQAAGQEVGRTGIFRDSVVNNIRDLYEVLESFNVVGDERLSELANMLASLTATEADQLREDDNLRRHAAGKASQVLSTLNDWLSPPMAQAAE